MTRSSDDAKHLRHVFVFALKAEWHFIKREYALTLGPKELVPEGYHSPPLYQFVKFPDAAVLQVGPGLQTSSKNFLQFLTTHECENVWHLGTCGALVPELRVGDVIVGTKELFTSATILKNKSEKEHIAKTYGAKIVDMESAGIAEICAEKNIPYTSIRVVFDTLADDLENIGEPYTPAGNLDAGKLVANIVKSPKLIMTLPLLQKRMALVQKNLAEEVRKILHQERIAGV